MRYARRVGSVFLGMALVLSLFYVSSAAAAHLASPSFQLDTNTGGSFGGSLSSTNYKMTSLGGEAVVGNGASGSYMLDQRAAGLTTSSMQITTQPSGLAAYYPLDENTGTTTADLSSNGNNGTLVSGPTWATGKLGAAVSFNGSNGQSISVPDSAVFDPSSQMTLSLWANQSSAVLNKALVSHWNYTSGPVSGSWALQVSGDSTSRLQFFVAASQKDAGSNYAETAASTWSTGSWHHITVVYDGTQSVATKRVIMYIDGAAASVAFAGTVPTTMQDAASPLMIGDFNGLNRTWNGAIDNVKLFSRALSPAEVQADYNAQSNGVNASLGLGLITPGISNTTTFDTIVTTNGPYGVSASQDHDLQLAPSGTTIPALGSSIASPAAWNEGITKGLGFSIVSAPSLDGKWGTGANFAAFPASATTFYSRLSGVTGPTKDVLGMKARLDTSASQSLGNYSNTVTITGTTIP